MEDIKRLNWHENHHVGDEKSTGGINGKLDKAKERLSYLEEITKMKQR